MERQGLVFWNTWYRASAQEQLDHVRKLDEKVRQLGAKTVLFCLSEVSSRDGQAEGGLLGLLHETGYSPHHTPVSRVRDKKLFEGLAFASQDALDFSTFQATPLRGQRGFASYKRRQAISMDYGGLEVVSAHLSYPKPHKEEIAGLEAMIHGGNQIFGGDFNTLVSKEIIRDFANHGLVELKSDESLPTVPLLPGSRFGFTLDHVLTSRDIASQATLEVGEAGPSNHRPLLVVT